MSDTVTVPTRRLGELEVSYLGLGLMDRLPALRRRMIREAAGRFADEQIAPLIAHYDAAVRARRRHPAGCYPGCRPRSPW